MAQIWIVTRDLGDGDVGLSYFRTEAEANTYLETEDDGEYWHESNPHFIDTDSDDFYTTVDVDE